MRIETLLSQRLSRRQLFESAQKSALMATFTPHELGKLIGLFLENEEKLAHYRREFEEVVMPLFLEHHETIAKLRPNGLLDDLHTLSIYWLFFRTAQDAFNVPWYLPWMRHGLESTFSEDERAFDPNVYLYTRQYGAMQRHIDVHPQYKVEEVAAGFEYLALLPQRHPESDWKEILWAASKLDRDALDAYGKNPEKEVEQPYWTLEDAIRSYLGVGPGNYEGQMQVKLFQKLRDKIFGYPVDRR